MVRDRQRIRRCDAGREGRQVRFVVGHEDAGGNRLTVGVATHNGGGGGGGGGEDAGPDDDGGGGASEPPRRRLRDRLGPFPRRRRTPFLSALGNDRRRDDPGGDDADAQTPHRRRPARERLAPRRRPVFARLGAVSAATVTTTTVTRLTAFSSAVSTGGGTATAGEEGGRPGRRRLPRPDPALPPRRRRRPSPAPFARFARRGEEEEEEEEEERGAAEGREEEGEGEEGDARAPLPRAARREDQYHCPPEVWEESRRSCDIAGHTSATLGLRRHPPDLTPPSAAFRVGGAGGEGEARRGRHSRILMSVNELLGTDYLLEQRRFFDSLDRRAATELTLDRAFAIGNSPSLHIATALADETLSYMKFHYAHGLPVNPFDVHTATVGALRHAIFNKLNMGNAGCLLASGRPEERQRQYQIFRQLANKPVATRLCSAHGPSFHETQRKPASFFRNPIQKAMCLVSAFARAAATIRRRTQRAALAPGPPPRRQEPHYLRDYDDNGAMGAYRPGMISDLILGELGAHRCADPTCQSRLRRLLKPYSMVIAFCPLDDDGHVPNLDVFGSAAGPAADGEGEGGGNRRRRGDRQSPPPPPPPPSAPHAFFKKKRPAATGGETSPAARRHRQPRRSPTRQQQQRQRQPRPDGDDEATTATAAPACKRRRTAPEEGEEETPRRRRKEPAGEREEEGKKKRRATTGEEGRPARRVQNGKKRGRGTASAPPPATDADAEIDAAIRRHPSPLDRPAPAGETTQQQQQQQQQRQLTPLMTLADAADQRQRQQQQQPLPPPSFAPPAAAAADREPFPPPPALSPAPPTAAGVLPPSSSSSSSSSLPATTTTTTPFVAPNYRQQWELATAARPNIEDVLKNVLPLLNDDSDDDMNSSPGDDEEEEDDEEDEATDAALLLPSSRSSSGRGGDGNNGRAPPLPTIVEDDFMDCNNSDLCYSDEDEDEIDCD